MQVRNIFLILLLVPLPISLWAIGKDLRYSRLLNAHELRSPGGAADFDVDGTLGEVIFERVSNDLTQNTRNLRNFAVVVIKDRGQELIKFPYRHLDSTRRTHVAVNNVGQPAHLLIYDGLNETGRPPNGAFAWNGFVMAPVIPSETDHEILNAMAARDDTGSWNFWAGLRVVHLLTVLGYYLPMAILLWIFSSKRRGKMDLHNYSQGINVQGEGGIRSSHL